MIYVNNNKRLKAIVDDCLLEAIRQKASSCCPNETGGLLVGWIDDEGVAHVCKQIAPAKEVVTRASYYREVAGMDDIWKELYKQGLVYLGEWHSHPNGSVLYSGTDYNAIKDVYEDDGVVLSKPLMLIVGVKNGAFVNDAMYAYDGNNKNIIKMERKVDLKGLFADLQAEMESELHTIRRHSTHCGVMGDATEVSWIDFLRTYLPDKYNIDKAIVIDSEGNTSKQIDIVIYDAVFTPFIFNQNGSKYVPAEGVYAVFEVKQDAEGYIETAGDKVRSVRELKRTTTAMVNGGKPNPARNLTKIIGGLLTSSCSYQPDTFKQHVKNLSGLEGLDCGCCLDSFAFRGKYGGEQAILGKDQASVRHYYNNRTCTDVVLSCKENSLFTFFLQLNYYLKEIGTVPAIDVNAYLSAIGEEVDVLKSDPLF